MSPRCYLLQGLQVWRTTSQLRANGRKYVVRSFMDLHYCAPLHYLLGESIDADLAYVDAAMNLLLLFSSKSFRAWNLNVPEPVMIHAETYSKLFVNLIFFSLVENWKLFSLSTQSTLLPCRIKTYSICSLIMFEVWFGGGRIENWVKTTYFPPNWKWTNYTAFFSLPTAVAGVGFRIQGFIEIPNKQDIQEVNLPKILKETSIFYQQHPPNK